MKTTDAYYIPSNLFYDRESHMWAKQDISSGHAIIGMDTLGLAALGDLAYVTLQAVGMPVKRGESMGTLEAAKMTGDIIAPISGIIMKRNDACVKNPGIVNDSPYEHGWLVAIKPVDWENESSQLISGNDLPAWVESEIERYKMQGWID